MTRQLIPYQIPDPAPPQVGLAPGWAPDLLARQCPRCGAVGTHYLTCPRLRLPSGYRVSEDPEP